MYKCTCIDSSNGYITHKHIHKIHSISKVTQINVNDSQEDGDLQFCHSEADLLPRPQRNTSEIQLKQFDNLLKELGEQVKFLR